MKSVFGQVLTSNCTSLLEVSAIKNQGCKLITFGGLEYSVFYYGNIYNREQLLVKLTSFGIIPTDESIEAIIVAAYCFWGCEFPSYFDGKFAISIIDTSGRKVFFARDRFGKAPLFYHLSVDDLSFSSTLDGLMTMAKIEKRINTRVLGYYFRLGYIYLLLIVFMRM